MMPRPKISVLIPTYNYARFLPEAIESVLAQDLTDFELILSDDCSRDESAEIIRRYASQDSRIRAHLHPANLGMVPNWNWCRQQARGEYLQFLFGDDRFSSPQALGKMAAMLDQHASASMAVCARHVIDEHSEIFDFWDHLETEGLHRGYDVGRRCLLQLQNLIGEPSVVMLRADRLKRGFDPRYRQIVDLELWCHVLQTGDLAYTKEPLCQFRRHARQQSEANSELQIGQREYTLLFQHYLDYYLPPGTPFSFKDKQWLFTITYYLRKNKNLHAEAKAVGTVLLAKLDRKHYLGFWLLHRITRPFKNLKRAWKKYVLSSPRSRTCEQVAVSAVAPRHPSAQSSSPPPPES